MTENELSVAEELDRAERLMKEARARIRRAMAIATGKPPKWIVPIERDGLRAIVETLKYAGHGDAASVEISAAGRCILRVGEDRTTLHTLDSFAEYIRTTVKRRG